MRLSALVRGCRRPSPGDGSVECRGSVNDHATNENTWGAADLRIQDLLAVLEFTERIVSVSDPTGVPQMLAGLAGLVGADAATLTRSICARGTRWR